MAFQRIVVSEEVDNKLRYLTGRTGLKANLLIRCGFCLSLDTLGEPDLPLYGYGVQGDVGEGKGRELHRYTLTGSYDIFFLALLRERLAADGYDSPDETQIELIFKAHLSRGVFLLANRVRSLEDIVDLVAEAHERFIKSEAYNIFMHENGIFPQAPALADENEQDDQLHSPIIHHSQEILQFDQRETQSERTKSDGTPSDLGVSLREKRTLKSGTSFSNKEEIQQGTSEYQPQGCGDVSQLPLFQE